MEACEGTDEEEKKEGLKKHCALTGPKKSKISKGSFATFS